jgi:tRNA U55 pseudouridine synthase TruB
MFPEDIARSAQLKKVLDTHGFTRGEMAVAIIDLRESEPKIFGYNMEHFIYPASVYKIFIGAEMLRRIEVGDFSLEQKVTIKSPNDVDKDARIFPGDTRKLLSIGEEVTIDQLLDLMLTRSDNTASNTLIDLVGRENITENIIHAYQWHGSEVTRKFLDRIKEDKPYQFSSTTLTCASHLAEFFYLVEKEKLISPLVSQRLKEYMSRFNRHGKQGLWLKNVYREYYCKGGWLETNLYKHSFLSVCKAVLKKGWAVIRWSNDVGVVTGEKSHYVVALLTVNKSISPTSFFPMQRFAQVLYDFMEQ